jgi:hypothetical protein
MYNVLAQEIKQFKADLKQPYDNIAIRVLEPVNVPVASISFDRHATTTNATATSYSLVFAGPYYDT